MKKWSGLTLIVLALLVILSNINTKKIESKIYDKKLEVLPKYEYGILVDTLIVLKGIVKKGQTLGEILYLNHIDHYDIAEVVSKSKGIFDVRRVNAGKEYTVICKDDSTKKAVYFIYEQNATNYVVIDLTEGVDVYRGKKEVNVKLVVSSGTINSSLSEAVDKLGISPKISHKLSDIYAWTIDFFKIQQGDGFRVYYENRYIEDKYIGIGKILAAEFTHKGRKFYSFYYNDNKNYGEYFDSAGNTLRKAFLQSPLDFYRISSRFSRNRKHPVTGKWKGHFGTDYAAPKGTPIMSTANGTIISASYTKNNGNFVKVRHNRKYTTQYLHMSKIKAGIKKGVYVKQGDIIGYVGSTGLATGPHVCYRFWKNGKQVDPYKEELPPGKPVSNKNKTDFLVLKDSLMKILVSKNE